MKWQLSNQLLRRDEIWFVEKDERGVSTLYSLVDFVDKDGSRIRKDESYEKNYLIVTDTEATERCYFEGLHQALPEDVRDRFVIKAVETKLAL